jgi:hypothetical protein
MKVNRFRNKTRLSISFILLFLFTLLITGCEGSGKQKEPTLPIKLPFAVHKAAATVSTELRIIEKREYPFFLIFMFNPQDRADEKRVRKLVGGLSINNFTGRNADPGIPISLKIVISTIDTSGERLLLEKEVVTEGSISYGSNSFDRLIGLIELAPGLYRVTVQSLKDIPELSGTEVILDISQRLRSKS